jgi:Tat protein secretion system quality control protein TatD with DNase activity
MRCSAVFPVKRLLVETDAPYQAQRGQDFSCWADLPMIFKTISDLRREAESPCTDAGELEAQIESNFRRAAHQE